MMDCSTKGIVWLRPFQVSDQSAAKKLINTGLGEHFGFADPRFNPDINDIWQTYVQGGHYFVVAELAGVLVGTGCLLGETAVTGRLIRMSVDKNYRRQGIGRQLVIHLCQKAHMLGYQQLLVETNHDWDAAINLYQAHGFVEYDRDDVSVYMRLKIGEQ